MKINYFKKVSKIYFFAFTFSLLSMKALATSTPTATSTVTPINVNSWQQFHYNQDNTGFNQYLNNPFLQPKWTASLGQPNVTYSSSAVVLDLGLLGYPNDPPVGIQGQETTTNTGILCVGTTQGKLLALRTLDGSQLWSYQTQGEIYSSPAFLREGTNSRIFFGSTDGMLRSLNTSGQLMWQYQTKGAILSSPTEGMIGPTTDAVIVGLGQRWDAWMHRIIS